MGRKLGYKDYTPLGYLRMGRTFAPEEAARFREQVASVLVPLCQKLYDEQAGRIGVDKLKVYDEALGKELYSEIAKYRAAKK